MKNRLLLCLAALLAGCSTPKEEPKPSASLVPSGWNAKAAGDKVMAGLFKVTGPEVKGAHDAHFPIVGGGTEQSVTVDQTQPLPAGEAFREVGRIRLRLGMDYTITVTNQDTKGFVILDAFQLLPVVAPAK